MPRLTEQEQQEIIRYLEADKPLPEKYRFLLFEDKRQVELVWNGKTNQVSNIVLPFQVIEQVDEPRAEKPEDTGLQMDLFDNRGRQLGGWTNKLIWGDNKLILSSLKNGPMREEIEKQGGIKLIYIDPPFDVGADFSMDIEIGDETFTKEANILEEIAYRDTWGMGSDSFISMLNERLVLMHDLLADNGSIFVHCDWRVTGYIRLLLDEIFGKGNIRNEIIWAFTGPGSPGMKQFNRKHNTIYWFSKSSDSWIFNDTKIRLSHSEKTKDNFKDGLEGSGFKADTYELPTGKVPESWWEMAIAQRFPVDGVKRVGYPTEKPWALIERIIKAASNEGDLIADFFCGGGIIPVVSEANNRKWVVADLGKFAIHTTRKRMIGVQRELKEQGKDYRAFEILNLGKYERQHYIGVNPNLREEEQRQQLEQKETDFLALILRAYHAEKVEGFSAFHGKKAGRMVAIGPVNLPVTRLFVEEIILECRKQHITRVDLLGFEFEMGLFPNVLDEAKDKGIDIAPKYIPADVFDKRAVERDQVVFHDVAYIEVKPHIKGKTVAVELTDFSVFYSQSSISYAEEHLRNKASQIVVEKGQIVKVSKDKDGIIKREVLTKKWTDWIDYWAVDFNFENKREIIRVRREEIKQKAMPGVEQPEQVKIPEYEEVWTGDFIFENEWQSFRTKKDRAIELKSVFHECTHGRRKIAVKVVDIFGNDTMTIIDVNIGGK
jgi:adenine specific DNA methylase Mod